jgi:hypothetical protein
MRKQTRANILSRRLNKLAQQYLWGLGSADLNGPRHQETRSWSNHTNKSWAKNSIFTIPPIFLQQRKTNLPIETHGQIGASIPTEEGRAGCRHRGWEQTLAMQGGGRCGEGCSGGGGEEGGSLAVARDEDGRCDWK